MLICQTFSAEAFPIRVNSTDDLIARLRQSVQTQYDVPAKNILVVWNDSTLEEKLRLWGAQAVVELTEQDLLNLIRKTTLTLRVVEGGKFRAMLPVHVKVDGWVNVCTLRQSALPGEILSEEKIQISRKKLSELQAGYLKAIEYPTELKMTRSVPAGTVLTSALLERVPLVMKGSQIRVIVINGTLRLVAQGEVLESGVRNQMVSVKVLSFGSNRMIQARVTGQGEVTLEMKQDK
jgi:flagella basal body P-ring formation protein FlgA